MVALFVNLHDLSWPIRSLILALGLFALAQPAASKDKPCLTLGWLDGISIAETFASHVEAALARNNICATVLPVPARRATQQLENGGLDGEVVRFRSYQKQVEGIAIRIDEPLSETAVYLVSRNPAYTSLQAVGQDVVGILRGASWPKILPEEPRNIAWVESERRLEELFLAGRLNTILLNAYNFKASEGLRAYTHTLVYENSLHLYLHVRHTDMIPRVRAALETYRAAGFAFEEGPIGRN